MTSCQSTQQLPTGGENLRCGVNYDKKLVNEVLAVFKLLALTAEFPAPGVVKNSPDPLPVL
jgi:hypothetical protein